MCNVKGKAIAYLFELDNMSGYFVEFEFIEIVLSFVDRIISRHNILILYADFYNR